MDRKTLTRRGDVPGSAPHLHVPYTTYFVVIQLNTVLRSQLSNTIVAHVPVAEFAS